jgi:hypothetical protein
MIITIKQECALRKKENNMPELNREDIIKALECCIKLNAEPRNFEICKKDCPYKFNCCDREKGTSVEKDALDLINRQQEKIECMQGEREILLEDMQVRNNQVIEQQAEIEEYRRNIKQLTETLTGGMQE